MESYSITQMLTLKTLQCGTCGVHHAIPSERYNSSLKEGGYWFCPNGHERGFSEGSTSAKLKKEIKRREWAESNAKAAQEEAAKAKRSLSAQKAANTRLKNRAKAGVCPCCNRTFKQLAAHMANKHPDFPIKNIKDS